MVKACMLSRVQQSLHGRLFPPRFPYFRMEICALDGEAGSIPRPLSPLLSTNNSKMDREPKVGETTGLCCKIDSFKDNLTCLPLVTTSKARVPHGTVLPWLLLQMLFRLWWGDGGAVSSWNLLVSGFNYIMFSSFHSSAFKGPPLLPSENVPSSHLLPLHCFPVHDPIIYLSTRNQNP